MRWTSHDLQAYQDRRAASRADVKPPVQNRANGPVSRTASDRPRFLISIVSYRRRLADPDGLTAKFFVDLLVRAGIVSGDTADDVAYRIRQEKAPKGQERTEIIIEPL